MAVRELPGDDAGRLHWLLFKQDDVISRRQALRLMPDADLRHRVGSGLWVRAHRGVYVAHNGPLTDGQRAWVGEEAYGGPGSRA